MEDKYLDKIYETERNVSIIGKDVEMLKEDMKEIKESLKKLLEEPRDELKFFKTKIASIILSGLALLVALGFGAYAMQQINTVNSIVTEMEGE